METQFKDVKITTEWYGKMNKQQIIDELIMLLENKGVIIRSEPLGSGGGLCSVKGKYVFFIDTQAPSAETAVLCAEAVLKTVDIEQVFIKPEIRDFIESCK